MAKHRRFKDCEPIDFNREGKKIHADANLDGSEGYRCATESVAIGS